MARKLEVGDKAPDFDLEGEKGRRFRLSDYAGKTLVLYFYPKDDTSGCTKQAIGFSEKKAAFAAAGAEILGVSKDTIGRHEKFRAKHGLTLDLASDPDNEVIERYGAWAEKTMYGRKFMGIVRSTFLIGPDSVICRAWYKVRVPGHVDEVLEAARTFD